MYLQDDNFVDNLNDALSQGQEKTQEASETHTDKEVETDTQENVTEDQGSDQTVEESEDEKDASQQTKTNPMRQLREQYNAVKFEAEKQRSLLERVAKAQGVSVEELEEKIKEEEDRKEAQSRQIPLEVQKQLRDYKERIKKIEQERIKDNFNLRANRFQQEFKLSQDEFLEFAEQANKAGFDIINSPVDLATLYRSLNYDTIISKVRDEARQAVLKEMRDNKDRAPDVSNTRSGIKQTDEGEDKFKSDEDFMRALFDSVRN